MKRRQHYKFISSIRSRASPAHCSCSGRLAWRAGGWAASRRPFVCPIGKIGQPHTLRKNYFLSGARQLGRIIWGGFHVAPSGIPGQFLRIHFHRDLKPCFVPDPKGRGHCGLSRVHWPLEQPFLLVRSAKQNTTEKAGVTWQVTAMVLTIHANSFTNKWVSYTFIATPRHSYSF